MIWEIFKDIDDPKDKLDRTIKFQEKIILILLLKERVI